MQIISEDSLQLKKMNVITFETYLFFTVKFSEYQV